MTRQLQSCLHELVVATHICANEGIFDAFGHVSARHPLHPDRYFLSRCRPPELIGVHDLIEFSLDSEPENSADAEVCSERVIHGEIYKARPDAMAVCHHHCSATLPFCITGEQLVPVYHLGASIGRETPFWDQRDEFGETSLSVQSAREGASLARALGRNALVLMRRHGATVVGSSIRELVFRTIYSCRNAEYQSQAMLIGRISPLSLGEIEMAGSLKNQSGVDRAWNIGSSDSIPYPGKRSPMRDFNDLYFFAAVVKNEGFSAAARVLGIPKSRISRRIANLEEQLGVRLLARSTRRLNVTEIGRDVYRHARAMMDEVEAVDEVALRMRSEPQGLVRVSCPVGVQRAISTALPTLLKRYPLLRMQFLITNRAVDVIEESVDVAIRIRERLDTDGELQMRRIGISRRILVAHQSVIKKHGKPDHPEDLRHFPIIHATERLGPVSWQLVGPEGRVSTVQVEPRISAGDFVMLLQAALEGVGLALLPEIDCQPALQAKQLVRLLPDWAIADGMIHLVFPSRRGMLPGVRAVIEFLAMTLQATIGSK